MKRQAYCAKNLLKKLRVLGVTFLILKGAPHLQANQGHCAYDMSGLTVENLLNSLTKTPCTSPQKGFQSVGGVSPSFSSSISSHRISYLISLHPLKEQISAQCCGFLSLIKPCSGFDEHSFPLKGIIGDPGHPTHSKAPLLVFASTEHFWQQTLHRLSFVFNQSSLRGKAKTEQTTFFFPATMPLSIDFPYT